jgi:hypothetical protein
MLLCLRRSHHVRSHCHRALKADALFLASSTNLSLTQPSATYLLNSTNNSSSCNDELLWNSRRAFSAGISSFGKPHRQYFWVSHIEHQQLINVSQKRFHSDDKVVSCRRSSFNMHNIAASSAGQRLSAERWLLCVSSLSATGRYPPATRSRILVCTKRLLQLLFTECAWPFVASKQISVDQ